MGETESRRQQQRSATYAYDIYIKKLLQPITADSNSATRQSEFEGIACDQSKARKMRACKSSGFDFGSHWLKWHEFCWPIINHRAKQCKAKAIYFQHSTENCSSPSHQLLMFLRKIIKQVLRVNFRNIRNSVAQAKCLMPEKLVLYRSDLITIHKNETQSYRFNLRSMITILPNIVLSAVKSTSDPNFL